MGPNGDQGERGTRGRQLLDPEPVLQRKERFTLSYSWRGGSKQEKRRGEDITQSEPHHITTIVSDRGAVQIARSDGAPGDRQGATKNTSQVRLSRIEESLREVGECMPDMPASERSKEDEIPTQVGGKLET